MAKLIYNDICKSFDQVDVLKSISLEIEDGELVALLGPSGCGKTTMLRLTAGFERPDCGTIHKGGELMSDAIHHVAPEKRNMGIVFQSYALWPNMTVAENVAYPLKIRKLPEEKIDAILFNALETVSLIDFADAEPATLSGGQRQRVALARCLVMQPDAVLLDEPLANLDAHLREVMQRTFVEFHKRSGATMVYVTHDQAEAMAMADRIAVMFNGEVAQIDKPQNLYHQPKNEQVARFIGQSSILTGYLEGQSEGEWRDVVIHGQEFRTRQSQHIAALPEAHPVGLCIRPENVTLDQENGLPARVISSIYLGERYRLGLEMSDGTDIIAYSNQPVTLGMSVRFSFDRAWAV
ncbi:ABC transporter ATP-binding protein [uncultured Cohaesibacter sp.]|uniref:ABC transporter ATP-binding protein n=1 Tax=uncultured Cohaesibacter sp. TaxID=1002546 RepID=UPI0029C8676F|nr:ABC transporter ATP-binding protein [uncultured Cohaesibacter sp.]